MSATFFLYSPLSPQEARELAERCMRAIEDYLAEHPDTDEEWAEVEAGGALPRPEDVIAAYQKYRLPLEGEVLTRLEACRSALTLDRPRFPYSPLQVSILRFLLERLGDGLCLLNDYPLRPAEGFAAELRREKAARGFGGDAPPPRARPVKKRAARPGEVRALRIHRVLRLAASDPELAIDVRDALRGLPTASHRYAALLLEEGAMADREACKSLGWSDRQLPEAADPLDAALSKLVPE